MCQLLSVIHKVNSRVLGFGEVKVYIWVFDCMAGGGIPNPCPVQGSTVIRSKLCRCLLKTVFICWL